jgi:hypothetical protein
VGVKVKKETEDIKKEIAANNKAALERYKASGVVSKVEVLPAPDCCPACRAIAGIYPLEQALELPYKGCTNPKGCRCCYLPVVD